MRPYLSRGDTVRVTRIPPSTQAVPPDVAELFVAVIGKALRVDDVDVQAGCVAVNVRADGTQADDWCQHTLWIELDCLTTVHSKAGAVIRP
jgi:hypothetical protein